MALAACSSSMRLGRAPSSMTCMPRAMAPLVTTTTSLPAARSVATQEQTAVRTSVRSSPSSSATMDEPSLMTTRRMRS